MNTLTIKYDSMIGDCVPDGMAKDYVDSRINLLMTGEGDVHLKVSSFVIIDEFRLAVKEKRIPVDQIKFKYGTMFLDINEDGMIAPWPDGFCDVYDKILDGLLGL